jgi:3-oxoacyl-[acyl-carrier-protein] synthase II
MSTPAPDVVVTGLGATTPLGADVSTTWDALLAGRSGVSRITDDWIADFPAQLVARLAADPAEQIDRVRARRLDRSQQVAVIAAEEAWRDAGGADAGVDPLRIAVVIGTGIGGALTLLGQDDVLEAKGPKRVSPFTIPMLMPNGPAAAVGLACTRRSAPARRAPRPSAGAWTCCASTAPTWSSSVAPRPACTRCPWPASPPCGR